VEKMKKILLFLFSCTLLSGAELFVGPGAPFKTIKAGIKAMKPGDTLTILPGVYRESIEVANLGAKGKTTTIRAKFPGTVLLRGDKEAPAFKRVPGTRFTYVTDWKEEANAVSERDTFNILLPAATIRDLEFIRGRFLHDKANGKLYISSTDGQTPDKHFYTISVIKTNGLYLQRPVNVVIEGLMVTGFYSHERLETSMSSSAYAIRINYPLNSTIRNCKAFFNANGIHIGHGDGGTIDNCTVFANGSYNPSSGGGLVVWCPAKNATIKNSLSFYSAKPAGPIGIRIYGAEAVNCKIENCISFGDEATAIKARNLNSWIINSYSQHGLHSNNLKNCTSAEEYRRFLRCFREEHVYEMMRLGLEVTQHDTLLLKLLASLAIELTPRLQLLGILLQTKNLRLQGSLLLTQLGVLLECLLTRCIRLWLCIIRSKSILLTLGKEVQGLNRLTIVINIDYQLAILLLWLPACGGDINQAQLAQTSDKIITLSCKQHKVVT
jgi:parallel beta-helix repeat protein